MCSCAVLRLVLRPCCYQDHALTWRPALAADPNLDMMFVGEEILHSARMWTHGYDIFSPDENLVSTVPACHLLTQLCCMLLLCTPARVHVQRLANTSACSATVEG